jgi:hypothetical protein
MTKKEKIGLAILIGLLVLLCLVYIWTFEKIGGEPKDPSESIFVKQRIINLEKSK